MSGKTVPHRWFHALVVTGASLTACGGGHSDDGGGDASGDAVAIDGASIDNAVRDASSDAETGNPIIIITTPDAGEPMDAGGDMDARNDMRCGCITR